MKKKSFYAILLCVICFIMSLGLTVAARAAEKPGRPKIISVRQSAPRTITIRWSKAKNANQYELFVSENGNAFVKLRKLRGRSYTHTGLKPGITYSYKLKAVNGKKRSGFSNAKSIIIPKTRADYYDELKAIILNSPERDKAGDPLIGLDFTDEDGDYWEFNIIYEAATDTFSFFGSLEGSDSDLYIELFGNSTARSTGRAKVDVDLYSSSGKSINMYTYLDMASYYDDKNVSWYGSQYNSYNLANKMLSVAVYYWNKVLKNHTTFSLKELGFTSYTA